MCSLEEKERLLESGEPAYYTTPHYDGYGSIIVNLSKSIATPCASSLSSRGGSKATPKLEALFAHTAMKPPRPRAGNESAHNSGRSVMSHRAQASVRLLQGAHRSEVPSLPVYIAKALKVILYG